MSGVKYSALNKGFYLVSIHGAKMPDDCVELEDGDYQRLLQEQASGKVIKPDDNGYPVAVEVQLTSAQIENIFVNLIQTRLDDFAKTRNYDNCLSCCSYRDSSIDKFAIEASYLSARRDQHWSVAYAILEDVRAGNRQIPTKEQLFSELGSLEWPN